MTIHLLVLFLEQRKTNFLWNMLFKVSTTNFLPLVINYTCLIGMNYNLNLMNY